MNKMGDIKTVHEEKINDIYVGMLITSFNESFLYCFDTERNNYILFSTIYDLNLYVFFGQRNMSRAYMSEDAFDNLYDNGIEKPFSEYLVFS